MNYYEHHLGDYAQATAHLSFVEDAAYSRLLRKYYAEEKPLPADLRAVQRLVGARTDEEREAVQVVLEEFFLLEEDGWHNKRADSEIAKVQAKSKKAKKSAEARWNSNGSLEDFQGESERNANASNFDANASKSHAKASSEHGKRNALQSPVTSNQTPEDQKQAAPSSAAEPPTDLLGQRPPADLKTARAQRLAQVTDEAIASFNASGLVKANGGLLSNVSASVGREKRQQQVSRCLRTARAICAENYGGQTITAEFWVDYWAECSRDEHKSGRKGGGRDHQNWLPSFEYLTREDTMIAVYDRASAEDAA
ncbi:YdaU family protein [Xanthomonas translucens]|uniref:YdaU family protein n=1 Tax=Xanthomonas campestris pv. translucens TaxID=343 RepID=UPI00271205A5|nr:YdaU family protein [Xanthomonas translucens]WLA06530.1 YdaU family protein [Xanthomonas translucens]